MMGILNAIKNLPADVQPSIVLDYESEHMTTQVVIRQENDGKVLLTVNCMLYAELVSTLLPNPLYGIFKGCPLGQSAEDGDDESNNLIVSPEDLPEAMAFLDARLRNARFENHELVIA